MSTEKTPIECGAQNGKQGRAPLLAKMDTEGIYLWCKVCHIEHRVSRRVLMQAWQELDTVQPIAQTPVQCVHKSA